MRLLALVLFIGVVVFVLVMVRPILESMDRMRLQFCAENTKQIRLALFMYANDCDGRLPLRASLQDLAGNAWSQSGHITCSHWGPIGQYIKNACIFTCPSDPYNGRSDRFPAPGISYVWRESLAGKRADELPDGTTMVWDREPFHRGKRNVALSGGRHDDNESVVTFGGEPVPERIAVPKR